MRITEIKIDSLFGIFDHAIPLNTDERITIIHGPNGFGKTVLLRMLDGLFNGRYLDLLIIPFRKFEVRFEDDSFIWIDSAKIIHFSLSNGKKDQFPINLLLTDNQKNVPDRFIEHPEHIFIELQQSVAIHLITEQRLQDVQELNPLAAALGGESKKFQFVPMVREYSK